MTENARLEGARRLHAVSIRDRIIKGIIVSGFQNDADIAGVLEAQSPFVEGTVLKAIRQHDEEIEQWRLGDPDSRENRLAHIAGILASLVKLKYNDPDILALVAEAQKLERGDE